MEGTPTIRRSGNRSAIPAHGRPLVETISKLNTEFSNMKNRLRDVQCENTSLRGELARWRSQYSKMPEIDFASLRRRVAYFCHPDRGGDADLMSRLNNLFDLLASMWRPQALSFQNARKG